MFHRPTFWCALMALALALPGWGPALAQTGTAGTKASAAGAAPLCDTCGVVQAVTEKKTHSQAGAVAGAVGGAVVGGILGSNIGGGLGQDIATVGGAAAGGYGGYKAGQKLTEKKSWVVELKMKDGSTRNVEQATQPALKQGDRVRLGDKDTLTKL